MPKATSFARLGDFARGVIWGLSLAGWGSRDIAKAVKKPDGARPSKDAVRDVLQDCENEGVPWAGQKKKSAAGAKRATTPAFDTAVRKLVYKYRGSAKVTVALVKKLYKAARKVSDSTIERRLGEAGISHRRVPACTSHTRLWGAG